MNTTQQPYYRQACQHFPWCTPYRCHFQEVEGIVRATHEGFHSVRDDHGTVWAVKITALCSPATGRVTSTVEYDTVGEENVNPSVITRIARLLNNMPRSTLPPLEHHATCRGAAPTGTFRQGKAILTDSSPEQLNGFTNESQRTQLLAQPYTATAVQHHAWCTSGACTLEDAYQPHCAYIRHDGYYTVTGAGGAKWNVRIEKVSWLVDEPTGRETGVRITSEDGDTRVSIDALLATSNLLTQLGCVPNYHAQDEALADRGTRGNV